jgi:predicted transcriptional regulator of viral defense system
MAVFMKTKTEKIIHELKAKGILKASEILQLGISKEYLRQLCLRNTVAKIARGYYVLPDYEFTGMQSIVEVSKQIPKGVICLLSALRVHDFTTQNPFEVWVAIERRAWKPTQIMSTQVRYIRFSGQAFEAGVQARIINNVEVKVYCPAKTVVDCFKYRNKIGLDVALEALREGFRDKLFTMDELWEYAKICRMHEVIRPYLEGMS